VNVDLVSAQTSDGIRLDGALRKPAADRAPRLDVDAVIFHHGVAGNFYNPSFVDRIGDELLAFGCAVLRVNNRGHDGAYNAMRRGTDNYSQVLEERRERAPLGAAFEIVDDPRLDFRAWIDFAEAAGYRRVALWGHSLGAVKNIYYLANEADARVRWAVASSPPRQRYRAYLDMPLGEEFTATLQRATDLIERGEPEGLLRVRLPNPNIFSARTYVDKYGPQERYDVIKHLPKVQVPLLLTLGGEEGATAGSADAASMWRWAEELGPAAEAQANLTFRLIEGADHFYTGRVPALWSAVSTWLEQMTTVNAPGRGVNR
jgi:pimeloyl-ACP methyl ester carboxylesterase